MKDWIGNHNSVFKTLGASNHAEREREQNDFYATSPEAIDRLLAAYSLPYFIWEPACGQGHLAKRLEERGYNVFATDLVNRGYGQGIMDFLKVENPPVPIDCILTNPPYKYATEFVLKALELLPENGECVMFLKTTFLEGKRRYEKIFNDYPPKYVFQFVKRVLCAKNADFERAQVDGTAVSYAWFIWEKGFRGETTIKWI